MTSDLQHLAQYGELEELKKRVEGGDPCDEQDEKGFTPLCWSARNNQLEVLNYLIEKGCNLNKPSYGGMSPLHHAANQNLEKIIFQLLKNDS